MTVAILTLKSKRHGVATRVTTLEKALAKAFEIWEYKQDPNSNAFKDTRVHLKLVRQ